MRFEPEKSNRQAVAALFARHREALEELLPDADVKHIGSTAVHGALTKGDLDLLLRVPEQRFAEVIETMKEAYAVDQSENWSSTFASFEPREQGEIPVGIQVVIAGSDDDLLFLEWRQRLRDDSALLERFNDFKRSQVGADPDDYVDAKAAFIESVMGRAPNTDSGG